MTAMLTLIGVLTFLAVVAHYAPAARYGRGHLRFTGDEDRDLDRDLDRQIAELRALPDYHQDPRV